MEPITVSIVASPIREGNPDAFAGCKQLRRANLPFGWKRRDFFDLKRMGVFSFSVSTSGEEGWVGNGGWQVRRHETAYGYRSACRIQVKQDGEMQEMEMAEAEAEEQLGAERSIPELERMLPAEFTARMRVFSADIASRLPKVCKVLETSSYDDLTNTDDVLSRVMSQTGDYGLEWGIFNFYNVFAMGSRDNTFSFEKEGEKDFSDPDGPSYRIDEQYEEYADGDPDFQPDEFPKQLAERIRGITEEDI